MPLHVSSTTCSSSGGQNCIYSICCHHTYRWLSGAQVERRFFSHPNTILFHILIYIHKYINTSIFTYVRTYINAYKHTYILTYFLTYLLTYWPTYLLTPCSRVLLEKLTGFMLVKKFPAFYGTRMFTTAFTRARHLSLSQTSTIQFIPWSPEDPFLYYPPIYVWVSQVVSFPQASPPKP